MVLCVDCKHSEYYSVDIGGYRCNHPELVTIEPVYGMVTNHSCAFERGQEACGPSGKLFATKPPHVSLWTRIKAKALKTFRSYPE